MPQDSDRVHVLFATGEEFADAEQYADALSRFQSAWDALSEPKDDQELAVQILAAIADCHFYLGAWDRCCDAVQHAFRCGADLDNPFFRLRLGQSLYELGNEREAANWLVPVYLMEGRKPFEGDDPKYLEFFRNRLQAPQGGWPDGW
jgi:tetratricopeptide (TPR) repeat protein